MTTSIRSGALSSGHVRVVLAIAAICVLALACAADSTLAAQPPHLVYAEGGLVLSGNPGQFGQIAVDQSRHVLLAGEGGQIGVYDIEGAPFPLEQTVGAGRLASVAGLAVDADNDFLYVEDAGQGKIVRYRATGTAPTTTYALDSGYQGPSQGSGPGELGAFSGTLAVAPTTDDLLVTDSVNHRVDRYAPNGAFISAIDGSNTTAGSFSNPIGVSVGADGTVYVLDLQGGVYNGGSSRLERFDAAGDSLGSVTGVGAGEALGIDRASDMTFVASLNQQSYFTEVHSYIGEDAGGTATDFGDPQEQEAHGVAFDESPGGSVFLSLYAPNFGGVRAFSPLPTPAPGVSINALRSISATSELVPGTIDAGSEELTAATTARFEYSADQGATWQLAAGLTLPAGASGAQAVSAELTGLAPNTDYEVRLFATNAETSTTSRIAHFQTPVSAPGVSSPAAVDVGSTTATLSGSVNPFGLQTSYHFEYGPTTAYGSRSPGSADAVLGQQVTPQPVNGAIGNLAPGTSYHYRLVATNSAGTTNGPDRTFTTDSSASGRAFEQITPVEKTGTLMVLFRGLRVESNAPASGALHLGYATYGAFPGAEVGVGLQSQYVATRGTDGWGNQLLEVPAITPPEAIARWSTVLNSRSLTQYPPDLDHSIVWSNEVLAPGAQTGAHVVNLYLEDNQTRALSFIASLPPSASSEENVAFGELPFSASADSQHVYVNLNGVINEVHDGKLTPVSLDQSGEPVEGLSSGVLAGPTSTSNGEAITYASTTEGAFLNRNGHVTPISVSERAGDGPTPQPASSVAFSEDGKSIFFLEQGSAPLTEAGATEAGSPIYRYSIDAPAGHRLTYVGGLGFFAGVGAPVMKISADGQTVAFASTEGLKVWHDGSRSLLASEYGTLLGDDSNVALALSPNGRYVAFQRAEPLTGQSVKNSAACPPTNLHGTYSGDCDSVFLADVDAETLVCVSCAADGSTSAGNASLGLSETVTDGGEVFFNTPTRLVSADVNSANDVYAYRSGHVHLISRGTTGTESTLAGATTSGDDVFFFSNDQLVSQDTDNAVDMYDARIGGGFAAQNPTPAPAPCAGAECHAPSPAPQPLSAVGSSVLQPLVAVGSPAPKSKVSAQSRCRKGYQAKKVKGKTSCVKVQKKQKAKKKAQKKKQANHNRSKGR